MARSLLTLALAAALWLAPARAFAYAQAEPATQAAPQTSAAQAPEQRSEAEKKDQSSEKSAQQESQPTGVGGELAKETREAEGEEEENANLKHSARVQWLAKVTGLSVHGAHLLLLILNFVLVGYGIFLLLRYGIPGMVPAAFGALHRRGESIQRALEEARTASEDANRRLADIENRLRQLDVEIGTMQASAEKEAAGEEARIKQAAGDEIRKVVQAAEQEIAAAAKLARRELSTHTADLAIALARKQIHVDPNTDQVLVRDFAAKLATKPAGNGGKDGR